jgi:hypothetical protein
MPGLLDPASVGGAATGGLLDAFMPHALAQLQQQQQAQTAAPGAAAPGAPAPAFRPAPLDLVNTAAQLANRNAYGTDDQTHLGILASAGFPMFNDPRLIQDQLATMAQAGNRDAEDELRRMIPGFQGSAGGGWGGGEGGSGGGVGEASNTGGIA